MSHINAKLETEMSPQAVDVFLQLCECAEMVHHSNITRADIIEKLAAVDRDIINQCHEDLLRVREITKTLKP